MDDERSGLVAVCSLAALAGAVDACGVSKLGDLYVSFMSGNTTSLGAAIAQADMSRAGLIATILALFVGGATAGAMVASVAGRYRLVVVVLIVAGLLAIPAAAPRAAVTAMTFSMGFLNAAMQRAGPVKVSITYITGTLVKFGEGLGLLLLGQAKDWTWLEQAVPWTGLLAGAAAATATLARYGDRTFWGLPIVALLIAAGTGFAAIVRSATRPAHDT